MIRVLRLIPEQKHLHRKILGISPLLLYFSARQFSISLKELFDGPYYKGENPSKPMAISVTMTIIIKDEVTEL